MNAPATSTTSDSTPSENDPRKLGGQPGNRNAVKNRPFESALKAAIAEAEHSAQGRLTLRKIARKLLSLAAAGDIDAIRVIADRLDGKPQQAIDITTRRVEALHETQANDLATSFIEASKRAQLRAVNVIDIKPAS